MKRIVITITALIFAIAILYAAGAFDLTVAHAEDSRPVEVILDGDTGLGIDENTVLWTPAD